MIIQVFLPPSCVFYDDVAYFASGELCISQILPKGADLSGAGSLAAILATPEVLETVAVLTFLAGMVIWTINFTRGALAALGAAASSRDEDVE